MLLNCIFSLSIEKTSNFKLLNYIVLCYYLGFDGEATELIYHYFCRKCYFKHSSINYSFKNSSMTNKEKTHYENGAYKSLLLTHHFCAAYLKALLIHKPYTHLYTHTYIYIYIYMNCKLIF